MSQIVDTGFLYALLNVQESQHQNVLRISQGVKGDVYLPTVVTTKVAYLVQRDLGQEDLAKFLDLLASETFV